MQKLKAIIFDLDGTIADTLPLCIQAFRQSIEPLTGRTLTDADIIAEFGPSEEGTIRALAPDHYDKGVADYLHFYETLHSQCSQPFEGIIPLLDMVKIKGVRIAMVTGKGRHSTAISLQQFNLVSYFELLETGSPEGPRKAEGLQLIMDQWKDIDKQEVLYVGDAPSDIIACRKVGIPVAAAAWAATSEPEKLIALQPDYLFYQIPDFAAWLHTKFKQATGNNQQVN